MFFCTVVFCLAKMYNAVYVKYIAKYIPLLFSILCCAEEEQAGQARDRSDHSISCAASQATIVVMMMIVATMTMTMWRRIINLVKIAVKKSCIMTNH